MATLWITELDVLPRGRAGESIPVGHWPPIAEQTVSFTTATQSSAFSARARFIRVQASAACCIAIGSNPTATTSSAPLAADSAEYLGINPGDKLSVVER